MGLVNSRQVQQRKKNKIRRHFSSFLINKARLKRSETYFKENYRPHELYDFDWDYWARDSDEDNQSMHTQIKSSVRKKSLALIGMSIAERETQGAQENAQNQNQSVMISQEANFKSISEESYMTHNKRSLRLDPGDHIAVPFPYTSSDVKKSSVEQVVHVFQRMYKTCLRPWNKENTGRNVDEESGRSTFSLGTNEKISKAIISNRSRRKNPNKLKSRTRQTNSLDAFWDVDLNSDDEDKNCQKMVVQTAEADVNLLAYRRGGQSRLRRATSRESEESSSNDSLVAGPPMMIFNEPLPNVQENAVPEGHTVYGDGWSSRDVDATLATAVSNTSRENLESVVSQLGLETPLQSKTSCHSPPQHLHSPQQSSCCRHAVHNISIESLDLDFHAGNSGINGYCCGNLGNRFNNKRGLSTRPSCSSINY